MEALTHTVELLAQMRLDDEGKYEKRFERILDATEKLAQVAESA